ncbi:MAG: NAD(P)-dependent oxidoreductase [Deltaproteobacteria bacterium]|nr:MAG: NAD(P)-dependent oxidoreductase [Deltaproteobacteria bacterium]
MRRLAFLGLGTMGHGMVRNLLAAGHRVHGWNRTPSRAADLDGTDGFRRAGTPAEAAAGAEVVFACLSNDDALRDVLFEQGVLDVMDEGASFVDCGTTSLDLTAEIARRSAERGVRFVDAPVTGSKLGAEGGSLTFMVGGAEADVAALTDLFEAMGRCVVHVGTSPGAGQAAKVCLNMTQAVMLEGIVEGLVLARRLGVGLDEMLTIFENSAARSGIGGFKAPYLLRGDFTPHFRLDLMHKDLHLAAAEAARRRIPLPAARTVLSLYDQANAEGLGPEDFLATAKLLERWGRCSLRDEEG